MNQGNKQQKFVEEWNEICKNEKEMRKMEDEMAIKKQKIMDEIVKEMCEKDEENAKLKKEIRAMKMKMAKMEADLKTHNISVHRRKMPAELLTELFGSLPLENAYELLAKMPNGILARNVQKMFKSIKMALKDNKLNAKDCGPKLAISDDGFIVNHFGSSRGVNTARAILPIPSFNLDVNKPTIVFYFEMQNLNKSMSGGGIAIGFCTEQFLLEENNSLINGKWNNTIMIGRKQGIYINGIAETKIGNFEGWFKNGHFVGIGLLVHHSPTNSSMECFGTWNGQMLGKVKLPEKFLKLQFFPAIYLVHQGNSIRTNFGKEEWQFKEFNKLLQ